MKAMFYWVWDLNMIPAHVPWETISVDMATGNTNVQEEGEICFVGIKNFLYFFFFFFGDFFFLSFLYATVFSLVILVACKCLIPSLSHFMVILSFFFLFFLICVSFIPRN